MEIEIKLFNNRTYLKSNSIIGKTNENISTTLKFILVNEMADKNFYIEFEKPDGTKLSTPKLDILTSEEIFYVNYLIPNSLLDQEGNLNVEVILRDNEGLVFKSFTIKFTILKSINATEEIEENFPDFVSEAQKVIDLIETTGDGKSYLSNDGTYKEVKSSGNVEWEDIENRPTSLSEFENDEGFITSFTESDPTVPSYVKDISLEDIEKWNNQGSSTKDYNELSNKPITNILGTEDTPIYLRELQTGAYLINGVCKPFNGSDDSMVASSAVSFINQFETVTAIQIFYPPYNQVQYFEVYDNNYISNVVALNDLGTNISNLEESKEDKSNKVTSITSKSTDEEYPSARCVYNLIGDIERLLSEV